MGMILCVLLLFGQDTNVEPDVHVRQMVFAEESVANRQLKESLSKLMAETTAGRSSPAEIEVIAWCCKANFSEGIPQLDDEALVLVKCERGTMPWTLMSIRRLRGTGRFETAVYNMRWSDNGCSGAVTWLESFTDKPDATTLIEFVKKSNFGKNELFLRGDCKILAITLFAYKSNEVVAALSSGIEAHERSRRMDVFMRMRASPANPESPD
jgi:hypothetical protein